MFLSYKVKCTTKLVKSAHCGLTGTILWQNVYECTLLILLFKFKSKIFPSIL